MVIVVTLKDGGQSTKPKNIENKASAEEKIPISLFFSNVEAKICVTIQSRISVNGL